MLMVLEYLTVKNLYFMIISTIFDKTFLNLRYFELIFNFMAKILSFRLEFSRNEIFSTVFQKFYAKNCKLSKCFF